LENVFIAPDEFKTVVYEGVNISDSNLSAEVFVLYGETPSSLDRILQGTYPVEIVNVLDRCELDLISLKYNKQEKAFVVKVKNTADVECWTNIELKDITINRIKQTIGTQTSESLSPGKSKRILIPQILTQSDLDANNFVMVVAYYGERSDSLVKVLQKRFELGFERFNTLTYVIFGLILIIIIFIILAFIARRREEEDD